MNHTRLQHRLERKKARLAKLNGIIHGDRQLADSFYLGCVGYLNGSAARKKAASLERTIDVAKEAVQLEQDIRWIESRLSRPPREPRPARERKPITTLKGIRVPPVDALRLYDAGFLSKEQYFAHFLAGGEPVIGIERLNARLREFQWFSACTRL